MCCAYTGAMDIRTKIRLLERYYEDIDQSTSVEGDAFHVHAEPIERIMDMFGSNAAYMRDGHPTFLKYDGKDEIQNFFVKNRSLVASPEGGHKTTSMDLVNGSADIIEVRGHFSGTQYLTTPNEDTPGERRINKGFPAELDFVDTWYFEKDRVRVRTSKITPTVDVSRDGEIARY